MRKWGEKGREERGKRFWGSCACAAAAAHAARTMAYRRGPGGGAFCLSTPYHAERLIQFMARNDLWPFHFYTSFCVSLFVRRRQTQIYGWGKNGERESPIGLPFATLGRGDTRREWARVHPRAGIKGKEGYRFESGEGLWPSSERAL